VLLGQRRETSMAARRRLFKCARQHGPPGRADRCPTLTGLWRGRTNGLGARVLGHVRGAVFEGHPDTGRILLRRGLEGQFPIRKRLRPSRNPHAPYR